MSLSALSVASEVYPLIKTGGLADVAGALPGALAAEGVATRVLLPGYPAVLAALRGAEAVLDLNPLFGGAARLLAGQAAGLDLFVLDAPHLYDRPGNPYSGPDGADWPDNPQRFAALAQVAARLGQGALPGFLPDVVHAHDWQAGLAPAYLHYAAVQSSTRRPGTVMTVHNLAFQGQCDRAWLPTLGLPPESWAIDGVESYGGIGFLKAGLQLADRVTTVSPTYAAEIRTPAGGMGLDGLLRFRGAAVSGILNGIDTTVWNPADDAHLPAPYSADALAGRQASRQALRSRLGLIDDDQGPVVGIVSRLSWQKGMDTVLQALPALLRHGMRLAVLGAGDRDLQDGFARAAAANPGRVGLHLGYDEGLAHLIQAGCDALLVPSRFEPCGLTQLCALRYGALPVVTRVGGLADTVIDANEAAVAAGVATGIQHDGITPEALSHALRRTIALYARPDRWAMLQRNAMRADFSWDESGRRYATLYSSLVEPT